MDERLEPVDKMLAIMDNDPEEGQLQRELAFALLAVDEDDPATLHWLAATCVARADELTGGAS